jgi:hypothetical protein
LLGKVLLQPDQSPAVVQLAVPSFQVQAKLAAKAAGAPAQAITEIAIDTGNNPARAKSRRAARERSADERSAPERFGIKFPEPRRITRLTHSNDEQPWGKFHATIAK